MNVAGIDTTKPRTQPYVQAIVSGCPGAKKIYDFKKMDEKNLPEEVLIMYGILAGGGNVFKWCQEQKHDFIYMDHSYYANCHKPPHWFRLVWNAHTHNYIGHDTSPDRYNKYFYKELSPWKKDGDTILVLPPTNAIMDFFNAHDWLENTLKILKENTDRKIEVREKPYNPNIKKDEYGATIKVDKPTDHKGPVDWKNIFATVTYNSTTVIDSVRNGVPIFTDKIVNAGAPISEHDFTKIETPKYTEREPWLYSLANRSFHIQEMRNGTAWKNLYEQRTNIK
jgi:hypothetical protein|tara:strand:- start:4068 stop:4910 length:843 start_codon:yes stop_codon:yes gene_type:complete